SLRWVSIREYAYGWSDAVISVNDNGVLYDPHLGVTTAIVGTMVVLATACAGGTRALTRFEIGE
ncbi:MAG: hypothetical protein ABGY25_09415, partial [Acidimicrobiales bacterium]